MASRGRRLVEAMRARGYTKQHALAYALGVNESTITRWKNDGPMTLDNVVMLCRQLDISADWFLTGSGSLDANSNIPAETPLVLAMRRAEARMSDRARNRLVAFLDELLPSLS